MQTGSLQASGKPSAGRRWARAGSWRSLPSAWRLNADGSPASEYDRYRHARIQARIDAARARHERYLTRSPGWRC